MAIRLTDIVTVMKSKWTYGDKFFGYTEEFNDNHNTQYPSILITPPDSVFPEVSLNNGWELYTFEIYFSDLYNRTAQANVSIEQRWDNLQDLANEWLDMFLKNYQDGIVTGFLEGEDVTVALAKEINNPAYAEAVKGAAVSALQAVGYTSDNITNPEVVGRVIGSYRAVADAYQNDAAETKESGTVRDSKGNPVRSGPVDPVTGKPTNVVMSQSARNQMNAELEAARTAEAKADALAAERARQRGNVSQEGFEPGEPTQADVDAAKDAADKATQEAFAAGRDYGDEFGNEPDSNVGNYNQDDVLGPGEEYEDDFDVDMSTSKSESSDDSGDTGCFITTAIVEKKGEADDGETLTKLRKFKNEYMADKQEEVQEYYEIAPKIVEAIDNEKEWKWIEEQIQKAVDYIDEEKHDDAYTTYKSMVSTLKEKWLV